MPSHCACLTSRCLLICCSALLVGRGRLQCIDANRLPRSDRVAAALDSLQHATTAHMTGDLLYMYVCNNSL